MGDGLGAHICQRCRQRDISVHQHRPAGSLYSCLYRTLPVLTKLLLFFAGFFLCHILSNQQVDNAGIVAPGTIKTDAIEKSCDGKNVTIVEKVQNQSRLSRSDGVEKLPLGIIQPTSDFYLRRLWGNPHEDLQYRQRGLLAMSVGIEQKKNVDAVISKFPKRSFSLILFHYDNSVEEWRDLEWSSRAIHVAAQGQSKWWFAKRFLTPSVVSSYDYLFIWDEDLITDNFDGVRYMEIMDKYKLEITQPALGGSSSVHYPFTSRHDGDEIHYRTDRRHKEFDCSNGNVKTPCAGFVEVMVPVFATSVWTCVWHMLQNDLVHCWGMDFKLGACATGLPHEKVAVVDSEWLIHNGDRILGRRQAAAGIDRMAIQTRGSNEWGIFEGRWIKNSTANIPR